MYMTYQECLEFLYNRNQFAIKLGLDNIQNLLDRLGISYGNAKIIHVAGTNGKGSLCYYLYQLLIQLGVPRVGLYSSPHLVDFRERILVHGKKIEKNWISQWMEKSKKHILDINSTYFETVTAMAFEYFQTQNCDVWILETGLGGRLDATNVAPSHVTAITSIAMDHENILGHSIKQIALEKLGIAKKNIPLALGVLPEEAKLEAVLRALELNCPLWDFNVSQSNIQPMDMSQNKWQFKGKEHNLNFVCDLEEKSHQQYLLEMALKILENWDYSKSYLERTSLGQKTLLLESPAGRLQFLRAPSFPDLVLDCGHNEEAWRKLLEYLKRKAAGKKIILLHSIMRDKNFPLVLKILGPVIHQFYFIPLLDMERCLPEKEARKALSQSSIQNWDVLTLEKLDFVSWLKDWNPDEYLLCICGSFYLLAKVLPLLAPFFPELSQFKVEDNSIAGN